MKLPLLAGVLCFSPLARATFWLGDAQLDRLGARLAYASPEARFRAHLSGSVDVTAYLFEPPTPAVAWQVAQSRST